MEFERDFDQNMRQLIQLLKKVLSSNFLTEKFSEFESSHGEKGLNIHFNVCFFNLFEDGDYDDYDDEDSSHADLEHAKDKDVAERLNRADVEFFRRNGIQF